MKKITCILVKLYFGDETELTYGGVSVGKLEIKNGIRQGCTGSPQIFLMVGNTIMKKVMNTQMGFRDDHFYIPLLYYHTMLMTLTALYWPDRLRS